MVTYLSLMMVLRSIYEQILNNPHGVESVDHFFFFDNIVDHIMPVGVARNMHVRRL